MGREDRQPEPVGTAWGCWVMSVALLACAGGGAGPTAQDVVTAPILTTPGRIPGPTARESGPASVSRRATPGGWPRLRIPDPVGRYAARQALDLTWDRLGQADCADVLQAFTDGAGQPLGERLRALSVDAPAYLTLVVFIDGSRELPCMTGVFAFTAPGSRVVRLCLDEMKRAWQQDPEHAVASFIHEMLHTLGLGENPPASPEITRRVLAGCGRRPRAIPANQSRSPLLTPETS